MMNMTTSNEHVRQISPIAEPTSSIERFPRRKSINPKPIDPEIDDSDCFHRSIGPILAVAQVFGILPVIGICSRTTSTMSFKMKSFRSFHTSIAIMFYIVRICILLSEIIKLSMNTSNSNAVSRIIIRIIFNLTSIFSIILFFRLSPRWVKLQREWRAMEKQLDSQNQDRPRLRSKFITISSIMAFVAMAEYTLYELQKISNPRYISLKSDASTICSFDFLLRIPEVVTSKLSVFTWTFTDLFIILVSTGLAERYKCLNERIEASVVKNGYIFDWSHIRQQYVTLSDLVKLTDRYISPLIVLSFSSNLFFICHQLYHGISIQERGPLGSTFFFFSFGCLVGRTVLITLLAARIHDESQTILPVIYCCPESCFNLETECLLYQLTIDDVALTGMRFFSLTRNFMLATASVIITYEVFLLQFIMAGEKTN